MKEFDITTALHEDGCVKGGSSGLGARMSYSQMGEPGRDGDNE
jgi:hypothetical protein